MPLYKQKSIYFDVDIRYLYMNINCKFIIWSKIKKCVIASHQETATKGKWQVISWWIFLTSFCQTVGKWEAQNTWYCRHMSLSYTGYKKSSVTYLASDMWNKINTIYLMWTRYLISSHNISYIIYQICYIRHLVKITQSNQIEKLSHWEKLKEDLNSLFVEFQSEDEPDPNLPWNTFKFEIYRLTNTHIPNHVLTCPG